jgi:predicted phosphodiesterase
LEDFNRLHSDSYYFLDVAIRKSIAKKKVVVTHHCPTQMANTKEFRDSLINEAFVVNLYDFIYQNPIDYWIFGHTHRNVPEIDINGTKVVCNQLGYVNFMEHITFKMNACINL